MGSVTYTVEFAMGVVLGANVAPTSRRQYGVQIPDRSALSSQIGPIRIGEVQSITASKGILYCGV